MLDADLEGIIRKAGDIPSLPVVAIKVLRMLQEENFSLDALEQTIEMDQAFSARVLKMANSPFYGRNRSIDSIANALMLIGFKTMSSLVMATAMRDMHRRFGLFEQKLWEHSLGASIAASLLAKETQLVPVDEAALAGLMHDVGKTVLNNSMTDRYTVVIEAVYGNGGLLISAEDVMLGFTHCDVGGFIARKWKLPLSLESAIEFHHSRNYPTDADPAYEPLCRVVAVADALANGLGIGVSGGYEAEDRFAEIGLTEARYRGLKEKFVEAFEEQKKSLSL
ncbi:MAG TPA: HDOD domain-containing protein [Dissulfurispiraceae bacterium]|nr:HDOD domain-containing protein [Dissulfurispiraceae bacterium]